MEDCLFCGSISERCISVVESDGCEEGSNFRCFCSQLGFKGQTPDAIKLCRQCSVAFYSFGDSYRQLLKIQQHLNSISATVKEKICSSFSKNLQQSEQSEFAKTFRRSISRDFSRNASPRKTVAVERCRDEPPAIELAEVEVETEPDNNKDDNVENYDDYERQEESESYSSANNDDEKRNEDYAEWKEVKRPAKRQKKTSRKNNRVKEFNANEDNSKLENRNRKYPCPKCPLSFDLPSILKVHLNRHLGICSIKCTQCKLKFKSSNGLKTHNKNVHGHPQPYKCQRCEHRTHSKEALEPHMKCHEELNLHCTICKTMFKNKYSKRQHMEVVHKPNRTQNVDGTMKCSICGISFESKPRLILHLERKHLTENSNCKCLLCPTPKDFNSAKDLITHLHSHGGTNRVPKCTLCEDDITFITREDLFKHQEKVHGVVYERFNCEVCKLVVISKKAFAKHNKIFHPNPVESATTCEICGKLYKNVLILRKHIKFVHGEGDGHFKCDICSKIFTRKRTFRAHIKNHENPNFKPKLNIQPQLITENGLPTSEPKEVDKKDCPICFKKFVNQCARNKHITDMHEFKLKGPPYKCCDEIFKLKRDAIRHYQKHNTPQKCKKPKSKLTTRNKIFKCQRCDFSSLVKEEYNLHKNNEHRHCSICNISYKSIKAYLNHCKIHHSKHECKTCFSIFQRKKDFQDHLIIHSNLRDALATNFSCPYCDILLPSRMSLMMHFKAVHEDENNTNNNKCNICSISFKMQRDLFTHRSIDHQIHYQSGDKFVKNSEPVIKIQRLDFKELEKSDTGCDGRFKVANFLTKNNLAFIIQPYKSPRRKISRKKEKDSESAQCSSEDENNSEDVVYCDDSSNDGNSETGQQ